MYPDIKFYYGTVYTHIPWPRYHPTHHGFDFYFGAHMTQNECVSNINTPGGSIVAGANTDGKNVSGSNDHWGPCPIFNGSSDQPVHQYDLLAKPPRVYNMDDVDEEYDGFAARFIRNATRQQQRWFLYFASHHTHVPQFGGMARTGYTLRGLQGDSLSLLDRTVGRLMALLTELHIDDSTMVIFSADNGGARYWGPDVGGVNGELACGKATNWEGGHRVPTIVRWPGVVAAATVNQELISSLDWYTSIGAMVGYKLRDDIVYDGVENSEAILFGGVLADPNDIMATTASATPGVSSTRKYFPYYSSHLKLGPGVGYGPPESATAQLNGETWPPLMAVRDKQYKLHIWTYGIKRPNVGRNDWAYRDSSVCADDLKNWDFGNFSCIGFGAKAANTSADPASAAAGDGCTFIDRSLHTIWREPLLFDLLKDPGENVPRTPLAGWDGTWPAPSGWHSGSMPEGEYTATVKRLRAEFERERTSMPFAVSQVNRGNKPERFPCCSPGCTPLPQCCTCDKQTAAKP